MEKIEFKNYEDSPTTPINAQALNAIQDNVESAINNIDVSEKADKSDTYTKTEVDTELEGKVDKKLPPRAETTNLNFEKTEEEWGSIRHDIVTNQVTTGKPEGDGFVTTYFWDDSGKYDSQLHIPNNNTSSRRPQWRSRGNDDEWGEWQNINEQIIENNDGSKRSVKFSSGFMINTVRVNVPYEQYTVGDTVVISYSFLTPFISEPDTTHSICISSNHRINTMLSTNLNSNTSTGGAINVSHDGSYSNRNSFTLHIQAMGRWK